jgi:signal peptidase I
MSLGPADPWSTPASATRAGPPAATLAALVGIGLFGLMTVVFGLIANSREFDVLRVPSGAMSPTVQPGSYVVVDRTLDRGAPRRGDIVVFRGPAQLQANPLLANGPALKFLKRVVAVGGDTVECCDADGHVVVDGKPLVEPYATATAPFTEQQVPVGSFWAMGDNRSASADSRVYGPLKDNLVVGKVVVITRSRLVAHAVPFVVGLAIAAPVTIAALLVLIGRSRRKRA